MDAEFMVSIISICATILLGIIGYVANAYNQRKNDRIKVIVQHRLDRRSLTIKSVSDLNATPI